MAVYVCVCHLGGVAYNTVLVISRGGSPKQTHSADLKKKIPLLRKQTLTGDTISYYFFSLRKAMKFVKKQTL